MLVRALVTCVAVLDNGKGHISMRRGKTYNLPDGEQSLFTAGYIEAVEVVEAEPKPAKKAKAQ